MDNVQLVRALAGAAAIALLLLLLALRRRRAARAAGAAGAAEEGAEPAEVAHLDPAAGQDLRADPRAGVAVTSNDARALDVDAALEGTVVDAGSADDPVEIRSLRAQVRTLEQALERLSDDPEEIPAHRPSHAAADLPSWSSDAPVAGEPDLAPPPGTERYRRQVSATLRGLADRTGADEAPERTMARVVAAIERLESDGVVDRPVLPTVPAGTVLAAAARPAELAAGAPTPRREPRAEPRVEPGAEARAEAGVETGAEDRHELPEPYAAANPSADLAPDLADDLGDVAADPGAVGTEPVESVEPVRPVTPIGGGHRRTSRWSRHGSEHTSRSRS